MSPPRTTCINPIVHHSITYLSAVRFKGIDGAECEEFINAVRSKAFEANKDEDPVWMARYASTCFVGNALRWHISLDKETRSDWTLLESALMQKYPPVDAEPPPDEATSAPQVSTALIPTPAAAPPQVPTLVHPPPEKVYYVALVNPRSTLYLQSRVSGLGLDAGRDLADAICVKKVPSVAETCVLRVCYPWDGSKTQQPYDWRASPNGDLRVLSRDRKSEMGALTDIDGKSSVCSEWQSVYLLKLDVPRPNHYWQMKLVEAE
ncbi:hypothetical protein FRB99_000266 [Tulasnella sp. 403]|nr:hypothetical protein FRB99_000266 [Tulasnella sp. 403]